MNGLGKEVTIVMVEDDEGHARLIEKNIRRAGVHNEIVPFTNGTEALDFVLGKDRSGLSSAGKRGPLAMATPPLKIGAVAPVLIARKPAPQPIK